MKLKKLIKEIKIDDVRGSKEIEINGISANSKLVAPGNLFVAKRGKSFDGTKFIGEALAAGAVAIATDIYDPFLRGATQLIDSDICSLEANLAAAFYENPSDQLFMTGVTGTNGKTTTSYLIKHLMDSIFEPSGLIGTIECIVGENRYDSNRTTPEVGINHKMLREMVNQGCKSAVMEVSSHALHQGRVAKIDFDVAVFTNLTSEHLDYHGTMEEYARAKNILFRTLRREAVAVVNADDSWHAQITDGCTCSIMTYGIESAADLTAKNIEFVKEGTEFTAKYREQEALFKTPYSGRYNVSNFLAAAGVGLSKGLTLLEIAEIMQRAPLVSGRLEPVANELGLKIFVDYAHTDDSLEKVLIALSEVKRGRLITVFGCGGDRDRGKRPRMGRVAEKYSDRVVVTTDNPRTEDPVQICDEILTGFQKNNYVIEYDRRAAIGLAIQSAEPGDIVLIAGKGHEAYQIFKHQTISFDDRQVAKEECRTVGK